MSNSEKMKTNNGKISKKGGNSHIMMMNSENNG
jgi:hypothetical protein